VPRGRRHGFWTVAGALSIGMGIWTMHFIRMLGFHLPIAVSYDIWITLWDLSRRCSLAIRRTRKPPFVGGTLGT
jgi:NO-binding membrane sensor protein with MHYT domain